jgi:hypothetical protein
VEMVKSPKHEIESFRVADREALARVLREAIRGHGAERPSDPGLQSFAAASAGMSAPTLSRLLNQKTRRITLSTLEAIYQLVPKARHAEVRRAVLSPATRRILDGAWDVWESRIAEKISEARFRRWGVVNGELRELEPPEAGSLEPSGRIREVWFYLRVMPELFPDLYERFWRAVRRFSHSADRILLAELRVIEPLLDARQTAFIERDWIELRDAAGQTRSRGELRAFIRAGLERERILLNRPGEIQRAQDIAEVSVEQFAEPDWEGLAKQAGVIRSRREPTSSPSLGKLAGYEYWGSIYGIADP